MTDLSNDATAVGLGFVVVPGGRGGISLLLTTVLGRLSAALVKTPVLVVWAISDGQGGEGGDKSGHWVGGRGSGRLRNGSPRVGGGSLPMVVLWGRHHEKFNKTKQFDWSSTLAVVKAVMVEMWSGNWDMELITD